MQAATPCNTVPCWWFQTIDSQKVNCQLENVNVNNAGLNTNKQTNKKKEKTALFNICLSGFKNTQLFCLKTLN